MFKWCFWKDAIERAISAIASSGVSLTTLNVPFQALDWKQIASISVVAGVVSMLTSVSALGFGKEDSASFLPGIPRGEVHGRHAKSN